VPVPPEPLKDDSLTSKSLDDLNRDSPLKPLFYELDSSEVSAAGQQVLQANAAVLKRYPTWQITIEGHCDERGTAEYNLALGERRALAAKTYLVSLGIPADKVRTVSYGKEFPFDAGHEDAAWAKNRRAHFVITAK
jgi:peptidoglycan-associated lipoprotein